MYVYVCMYVLFWGEYSSVPGETINLQTAKSMTLAHKTEKIAAMGF